MLLRLICCLILAGLLLSGQGQAGATQAPGAEPSPALAAQGQQLKWVEMSVGGVAIKVAAGGVLALHPDAPFRLLKVRSEAWLDFGLKTGLAGFPTVDLNSFHTLNEVLGERVFSLGQVEVQVRKGERLLGSIHLAARLLPIDWLRKAEEAPSLEERLTYTAKALEISPDDRLIAMRQVDLLGEAGRYQEALDLLRQHQAASHDPALLLRLADLHQRFGQMEEAAQVLRMLLDKSPRDQRLLERLAALDEQLEKWEELAPLLEALLDKTPEPEKGPLWGRLGRAMAQAGRWPEAQQAYERAVKLSPYEADLWQALAQARAKNGEAAAALEAQRRATTLAPANLESHQRLAASLLDLGSQREAAQELEKAFTLNSQDAGLLLQLSGIYQDLGDLPAQLGAYRRLAKLKPGDPDVNHNLGLLLLKAGQPQEALAALEPALAARPQDLATRELMLEAQAKLKRWDQAASLALALAKERPGDLALVERLYVALVKQRPQAVAEMLDQALAGGNRSLKVFELRAALALDQDDAAQALRTLEAARAAHPDNMELAGKLADLYEAAGQEQKALVLYEQLIDKAPGQEGLEERYLQLRTRLLEKEPAAPAPPPAAPAPAKP